MAARMLRSNRTLWLSLAANFVAAVVILQLASAPSTLHGMVPLAWFDADRDATAAATALEQQLLHNVAPLAPPRCGLCDVAPETCDEFGADFLTRSVEYEGTNARLRRALAKMRRGEPFTVAVVGGSVSTGHGITTYPQHTSANNVHRIVFDHLNSLFPSPYAREQPSALGGDIAAGEQDVVGVAIGESAKAEGKNSFVNGAQPASGSNYWNMCYVEHVPDDVDLVLVELAINDQLIPNTYTSHEILLRALLDLPGQPAIISMHVFALMFDQIATGGELQIALASHYDLPVISLRNPLLPRILENHTLVEDYFAKGDLRHIGDGGHRTLAQLVTAYIDRQLCEMDAIEAATGVPYHESRYPVAPVPRMPLSQRYDTTTVMPSLRPNCFSSKGVKFPLVPAFNDGWRKWERDDKKYWIADTPGARISVNFSTVLGTLKLYYLRSATFGLGSVKCWIDDDTAGAHNIEGHWNLEFNIGQDWEKHGLARGDHVLNCELLQATADPKGGHEFRIISIMSI